ncbi:MAG TPA: Ti-type conjugative transfer relaxase TraA [Xanthobacteraceae bacterium]|nr:Ti-type conjugative transfer relaxase TraA [Xanthobacteraceae bacterium]
MGAYHFTAKIHSRAAGASAVRAAAYRAGERLYDERLGKAEDYSRKLDVIETVILAPKDAPAWSLDRAGLWNRVEAREKRRDAQLAQEFELNLPRELSDAENWRLITDFARKRLVAKGRICDIAFHRPAAGNGNDHPHAHILMPLRMLEGDSFGDKHPDVDWRNFFTKDGPLTELRREWCEFSRGRAAELGIDLGADWDHRSYLDRGLDVEPQPKIGAAAQRMAELDGSSERVDEVLATQRRNGEKLLAEPGLALEALTRRQSTFAEYDLARWVHSHSADDQFEAILARSKSAAVAIGQDERGRMRYSTREMIDLEAQMIARAVKLAAQRGHEVKTTANRDVFADSTLHEEQKTAGLKLLSDGDLSCLVGYAGAGKSTMLREVRARFEEQGYRVKGAALSGIAAENLEQGSGIGARTLASWSHAWQKGYEPLDRRDVLVVDEAGMIGSRQLADVLQRAEQAGAKVILVGDPEQLQAIEAGAAFRAIQERTGAAELTQVRRQNTDWQRTATRELATGQTAAALDRYAAAGAMVAAKDDNEARSALVRAWHGAGQGAPDKSRIMLAHTRTDVEALNVEARALLRAEQGLGNDVAFETSRGKRQFAEGDRLLFLRNERNLGVKNGMLATVDKITGTEISLLTDDGRKVRINTTEYRDFDHGYAVTVHKAQGVTVDQSFVLATQGFDRHLTYVAMSRHRDDLAVVYSRDQFKDLGELSKTLGRERAKDVTVDYLDELAEVRQLHRPSARKGGRQLTDDMRRAAELRARASERSGRSRDRPELER